MMHPAERSIESLEHGIYLIYIGYAMFPLWVFSAGGEALAKSLGKARFGHYESNGDIPVI